MKNKLAGTDSKKRVYDLLFKRPEGLAGLVVVSIILSYFILSPSEEQNTILSVNESDVQSIDLPIPSTEQDDITVQIPIAQKAEIEISKIVDDEAPFLEESEIALFETQEIEVAPVIDSTAHELAEINEPSKIAITQIPEVNEKVAIEKMTEKVSVASKPKSNGETKKTAVKSWVFAKDSDFYTIQLIGSSNRKEIEKFIKTHQKQNKLSYFHTIKNNKSWYVVVTGNYKSFKEAESERKNLPQHLAKYGAWTRNYLSIQKEITANAEKIILLSNAVATSE